MKKYRTSSSLSAMAAAILALGGTAALALPAGSYQKSCSNVSVSGTTLSANCRMFNGQNMQTTLPYFDSCVGDIGNINGALACADPNGSYALSCQNATVKGDTLSARCKKRDGQFEDTSLKGFQGYQGDISNCDGKLISGNC